MEICSNAEQLRNALNEIKPTKIAVAYVGAGWEESISLKHLKEIIVSPTLGSNPFAIEEIMRTKGAENVHFLDNLHSKLYLGKQSALLGSPNLSDNGFANLDRFEIGVVLNEPSILQQLDDIFEHYKNLAKNLYTTTESKQEKLKLLTMQWRTANWNNVNTACNEKTPSIGDYRPSQLDRIHIVWYIPSDLDFNREAIAAVVPAIEFKSNGNDPKAYFSDWCTFLDEDSVNEGDWILCWRSTNYGLPDGRANLHWMQIHYVIPNGVNNTPWTKLACQSRILKNDLEPFFLDSQTTNLIREALTLDRFHNLRWSSDDEYNNWRLAPADKVVPKFLSYIQEQYLLQAA